MHPSRKPSTLLWLNRADKIKVRNQLLESQNGECAVCGEQMGIESQGMLGIATFDHIIPQSKGGDYSPSNICLAHKICNSLRGDSCFYKFKESNEARLAEWCGKGFDSDSKPPIIFDINGVEHIRKPKAKARARANANNKNKSAAELEWERNNPILFDITKSGRIKWR